MSNAMSALRGEVHKGSCTVTDLGPSGMITLRGDLSTASMKKAVGKVPQPLKIADKVAWMSPDELLVFCDYEVADETVAKVTKALGKSHALAVNVSDARAHLRVQGAGVRDVIAKLTPTDVSTSAFKPGDFRRSRLAQVAAAFWMVDEQTVEVVCFRSVARYVFDILSDATN